MITKHIIHSLYTRHITRRKPSRCYTLMTCIYIAHVFRQSSKTLQLVPCFSTRFLCHRLCSASNPHNAASAAAECAISDAREEVLAYNLVNSVIGMAFVLPTTERYHKKLTTWNIYIQLTITVVNCTTTTTKTISLCLPQRISNLNNMSLYRKY